MKFQMKYLWFLAIPIFFLYLFLTRFFKCKPTQNPNRRILTLTPKRKISFSVYGDEEIKDKLWIHFHGTPGSSSLFPTSLSNSFASNGYCVIVPDRSGFAQTTRCRQRKPLDVGFDISKILSSLSLAENCLITISGHSAGCLYALAAYASGKIQYPVNKIVLLAPAATHKSGSRKYLSKMKKKKTIYRDLRGSSTGFRFAVDHLWFVKWSLRLVAPLLVGFPNLLSDDIYKHETESLINKVEDKDELKRQIKMAMKDTLASGVNGLFDDIKLFCGHWGFDHKKTLPEIPIDIYISDLDGQTGLAMSEHIKKLLPNSNLIQITDHTHHSLLCLYFPNIISNNDIENNSSESELSGTTSDN
ncbi:monoacylglycerol lipase [Anaeramoeba flamelloides]|uniref:Monoacylglycerol lipase n=1 Tax=Anaeramoeba flamelloides TaxID=1746091 RepID=A0AAV7Y9D3_9EUKA|nr:monoacylglycerol lipase [Anaeramoeba flamelloides]